MKKPLSTKQTNSTYFESGFSNFKTKVISGITELKVGEFSHFRMDQFILYFSDSF